MPTWMTTLWNAGIGFNTRPLRQITIPGTHDAGCYVHHTYGDTLSRTQTQDIGGQLAGGIRYFDIRPYQANYISGRSFWTYHGPYSGGQIDGLNGILAQVANFMANVLVGTDRELVILNFSHFRGFGNADHQALVNAITAALGPHLVPYTQAQIDLFEAQYTNILTNAGVTQSRVAILYDGALDTDREAWITANVNALPAGFFTIAPKYLPAANQIRLFDQYANAVGVGSLQLDQLAKLRNRVAYRYSTQAWAAGAGFWDANAVGGVASTLHLFSWTLTPQPLLRDPLTAAALHSNPLMLYPFSSATAGWAGAGGDYDPTADLKINILYVDDYASQPYTNNPMSPMNAWALPVAMAARLNAGPLWPTNW